MILRGLVPMLLAATPAVAQLRPQPVGSDPHTQVVDYVPDRTIALEGTPGYQLTLELAPDEQVQSVAVGDASLWQVSANRAGNRLFLKPVQAGPGTNMTVLTNTRTYSFELSVQPGGSGQAAYTVRLRYPRVTEPLLTAPGGMIGYYRLSGARSLRPATISDDGERTFIEWPAAAALPAVYALDDRGREALANGQMREGIYVVDGVSRRLVFRIDDRVTYASRRRIKKLPK